MERWWPTVRAAIASSNPVERFAFLCVIDVGVGAWPASRASGLATAALALVSAVLISRASDPGRWIAAIVGAVAAGAVVLVPFIDPSSSKSDLGLGVPALPIVSLAPLVPAGFVAA